jgi:hypothetical protein
MFVCVFACVCMCLHVFFLHVCVICVHSHSSPCAGLRSLLGTSPGAGFFLLVRITILPYVPGCGCGCGCGERRGHVCVCLRVFACFFFACVCNMCA